MNPRIFITLFLFLNFFVLKLLFAQQSDKSKIYAKIDKSIENINRFLGSDCKMRYNKEEKELAVMFYESGVPFREDKVYLDALDPNSVHYVEEEKAVSVKCIEFKNLQGKLANCYGEGCVGREFSKDKKILSYSRIAFFVSDKNKNKLERELKNLIMLGHELSFR